MKVPSVDVVIVNWNAGAQLQDCMNSLSSVKQEHFLLQRVVVVDNASSDGSADNLEVEGVPIEIIRNSENVGFGAATNQGARRSQADYLLFLNPDTRVYPETLAESVRFMESAENSEIGIATVQLIDEQGTPHRCCSRFPTLSMFIAKAFALNLISPKRFPDQFYLEWDHSTSREVEQVQGAFLLIRRALFESLHGFDERFFVYLEDVDLGLRARQAGWKSYHFADVKAYHKGGGTSEQVRARRLFYSLRSRLLYGAKHFSTASSLGLFLTTLVLEPVSRVALALWRLSASEVLHTIQAYYMLYTAVPGIIRTSIALPHWQAVPASRSHSAVK